MKKISKYGFVTIFISAMMIFVACTKEMSEKILDLTVSTPQATDVTSNSAKVVGFIIAAGDGLTERGVCYSTTGSPNINDTKVKVNLSDDSETATFEIELTGLDYATTYYVRAYAMKSHGITAEYGNQISFTTLPVLPTVTTTQVSEIKSSSATGGGNVTNDGGADITARGICWSTDENPDLTDNKTSDGIGDGAFTSAIDGLLPNTTYYVRAYATNSVGTVYGNQVAFTSLNITKLWVVGSYNGWDNSDAARYIEATENSNGEAQGYVYMPAGEFKLTLDHSWGDDATFGDDGTSTGTLTNPGGNIAVPSDGFYWIKANLGDMTYSLTKTDWAVIGDATPGGWGTETPLSYSMDKDVWYGGMSLTANSLKFRANNAWDINYGSAEGDGTLQLNDPNNIPIGFAADYAITVDFSTPNAYTYSINRWGVIGGATPDPTWGSDFDMTWDAVNGVFTIDIALTVGEFKFRANDDWGVNLGGDLNALTNGGGNIAVSTAGNYTITLNPWTLVATVTLNP